MGLQEPSTPSIQQDPSRQDMGTFQQGVPAGGSQQDQQGPQGASLVELQELHSSLMHELKSLKKAAKYSRRLETVSQGMMRGIRDEVEDMWRAQGQQSETRSEPQQSQCLYPELHRTPSMLREFFSSLVEPGIYRLDMDVSESDALVDSGKNSVDLE